MQNAADAAAGIGSNSPIAPGSLAFVTDYSTSSPTISGAVVSIRPIGSSTAIPAQVVNASNNGITFLVPADAPQGNAQLIYHQAGELAQYTSASIASGHFSLYRGTARGTNVTAAGVASANGLANPAQPGEAVEIFGTGLSTVPQTPPQVTLGGVAQPVLFSGAAPGEPGLFQINIQIAAATPDGCYVPLAITWDGSTASSYLSKTSDEMPCHHPFGLSTSALQALDNGGQLQTGMISMSSALTAASAQKASRQETAGFTTSYLVASGIANYFLASAVQGCGAQSASFVPNEILAVIGSPASGSMTLQSGTTTLTLTSSPTQVFGYSASLPPAADAPLNNLPQPVISGGQWTWTNPASGDGLPAASFNFSLPSPIQLNAGAPISIQTGQDQTIAWNGRGFDSGANLQLILSAPGFPSLACFAPANTGTLTIPAAMLAAFHAGASGALSVSVTETGANIPHYSFPAPATALVLVQWSSSDTRPVDFK